MKYRASKQILSVNITHNPLNKRVFPTYIKIFSTNGMDFNTSIFNRIRLGKRKMFFP